MIEQRDVSGHSRGHAPVPGTPSAGALAPAPPLATTPEVAPSTGEVRIDGTWAMVLKTPMGPQAMTVTLRTEGEVVSGTFDSPEGTQDFTGGRLDGNRLTFDLRVEKPMKITLKYDLLFAGDSVAGKCKMGMFGSAKVNGERA